MRTLIIKQSEQKESAAQNARDGLVTVSDLSLLTGIPVSQLTKFAKTGQLEHFGEYHGKRFFNFQTIATWAAAPGDTDVARATIRKGMEIEARTSDCPYSVEIIPAKNDETPQVKLSWKAVPALTA